MQNQNEKPRVFFHFFHTFILFFSYVFLLFPNSTFALKEETGIEKRVKEVIVPFKDGLTEEKVDVDFCDVNEATRSKYLHDDVTLILKNYGDIFEIYEGNLHFNQKDAGNPGGKYGIVHFTNNVTAVNAGSSSEEARYEGEKKKSKDMNNLLEENKNYHQLDRDKAPDLDVYPPLYCALNPFKGLAGPGIKQNELIRSLMNPCSFTFIPSPRDALIFLGCTPPLSDYFSIRSYLGVKEVLSDNLEADRKLKKPFQSYLPFAELGDPANILTLNTTKGTNEYNATVLLTSTGDSETRDIVFKVFQEVGFPQEAMNVDIIPNDLIQFRNQSIGSWVDDLSDSIAIQFRVSGFHNATQRDIYYNTTFPVLYLHTKSTSSFAKQENMKPLYRAPYRNRGTGDSQFQKTFIEGLDFIQEKILNIFSNSFNPTSTIMPTSFVSSSANKAREQTPFLSSNSSMIHLVPDPVRCIQEPSTYYPIFYPHDTNYSFVVMPTCDWFSNDALYSFYPNISTTVLTFPVNRVYAVVGYDQSNLGRNMFYNLLVSTPLGFEQSDHTGT